MGDVVRGAREDVGQEELVEGAVEVGEGGDRTMIGTAGEVIGVVETEIADPLRRLKTSSDV